MRMGDTKDVSKWVVGLLVAVLIATALLPTLFSNLNAMEQDTTNFSTVEIAIISVVGILILVGFLYKIMRKSGV